MSWYAQRQTYADMLTSTERVDEPKGKNEVPWLYDVMIDQQ